jgi:hypothetical protein
MLYATYVAQCQQEGSSPFLKWLEKYIVDSFSGTLHVDQVDQYGFSIPERPADALWYFPGSNEEGRGAPLDSRQSEWWQEDADGVVLGIEQQSDSVQCCDHFTWFRIPLDEIARLMRARE